MGLNIEICNAFNAQAHRYDQAAFIQQEIGKRLFERLTLLTIKPKWILDLGCGSGVFTRLLKQRYPDAQIVGLDGAFNMLKQAKSKQPWFNQYRLLQADMNTMPFPPGLFDLVFANQVIHWTHSMSQVLREINRVMRPGGCLMFSTLGPDTFIELRQAWAKVDSHAHTNTFLDMHDLGDMLMAEQFQEPVVDMDILTAHYKTLPQLFESLKAQGVRNINPLRNHGLTGRRKWSAFEQGMQDYCTQEGRYPLTYEVVFGHAWRGDTHQSKQGNEIFIPVSQLRRSAKLG